MNRFFYILILFFISSCRKDVQLKLPDYTEKIVIEGSIENGSPAVVLLSYSVPYFGDFDFSAPQTAFIHGALVTVTDGTVTDTLKEVDPSVGYLYLGDNLLGQENKIYTINVTVNGKSFNTSTAILHPPKLDTAYFQQDRDSLGLINQHFSEPAGSGDCYRWFAKRLGRDRVYVAPFNSVFDDKFVDGKSFEFAYNRGRLPNPTGAEDPERGYYKLGDTIVVKFCRIGRNEYEFWNTYYQNKSSNGNPFSAPSNVKSMFSDYKNAFGAFVGYAARFDTIIMK
ncbi:MAG TPA: DUF4249 family protein [Bacteroidia bacterium]|nr:DUF4249 family protein [Bacteroidia bacterium]